MKIKRKIIVVVLAVCFVFCSCDNIKFGPSSASSGTVAPERDSTVQDKSDFSSDSSSSDSSSSDSSSSESSSGGDSSEHRPGEDVETPDPDTPDTPDNPENPDEGGDKDNPDGPDKGDEKEDHDTPDNPDPDEPDDPAEPMQLAAPVIRLEGDFICWDAVEGAMFYKVYIVVDGDTRIVPIEDSTSCDIIYEYFNFMDLKPNLDFSGGATVYVEAHAEGYLPSPPSNTLVYMP